MFTVRQSPRWLAGPRLAVLVLALAWVPSGLVGGEGAALRQSQSTSTESVYQFIPGELYRGKGTTRCVLRYENSWSDLPDTLVPGQPFNVKLGVALLEKRIPNLDKFLSIGELRWSTGVMVTAGRDWITRILTTGDPVRMSGGTYQAPEPSPQLMMGQQASAGYISNEKAAGDSHAPRWVDAAEVVFDKPVPDLIPDKDSFEIPARNIDGEMMLVIVSAMGLSSRVYLDSNYLYIYSRDGNGQGVWKLRTQFNTSNTRYEDTDNEGSCTIESR